MAKGEAYCVEMKRNVTIIEARDYFFSLPEPRQKLTFLCGDDRCRAILRPPVVGESYHKLEDAPDKKKSPCFRENAHHQHIMNCTWISKGLPGETVIAVKVHNARASQACAEMGLIFRPYTSQRKAKNSNDTDRATLTTPIQVPPPRGKADTSSKERKRPETNRFMPTVAIRHLNFSLEQKQKTPLEIQGFAEGSFYEICIPIKWFHPYYQSRHIYYGRCDVKSLMNVFMVKFRVKISLAGDRDDRTVAAEFSLPKTRLSNENEYLLSVLERLAKPKDKIEEALCYFFSETPPDVMHFPSKHEDGPSRIVARFSVKSLDHIAVIPLSELTEPGLVEQET